ncbi:hypothetical protein [Nocardia abscessus]|uniref:hypothetical protein n=1 Tax=Nocardia abscessus TaxID=120957 RepID=UPI00031C7EA4|nr:hypothetical protein [Nocardia abscessus]MCC3332808.1 hypothetical protein [Nocardia abscessus]
MGHLLTAQSSVGSMSTLLSAGIRDGAMTPRPTGTGSAAIAFAVADSAGVPTAISGAEHWADDPHVVEHTLAEPGTRVRAATDNRPRLGVRRVRAAA